MQHEMKLTTVPFEKMRSGRKTIESRLYDEKRKTLSPGDEIVFINTDDATRKFTARILALYRYPSFQNLMHDFPSELFGWEHAEDAIKEIEQFYSTEDIARNGVIGIRVEKK